MKEFRDLGISKKIVDVLEEMTFEEPSPIQKKTIPLVMEGKDVIGNAATGSGKTLAFASGIIDKVVPEGGIQSLVLTPTRELADQIAGVMRKFAKNTPLKIQEIYGGVGMDNQISGARRAEIIVGTPGRILDHLQRGNFDFMELKILVLDEADRMVDMGFLPDVEKIIGQCPIKRQTLLFSATSSPDIAYISKKYMKEPVQVTVETYVDASKLKQYYYDVPSSMKFSLLVHLLKTEKRGIIMVFCNTRKNVDLIAMNLKRFGVESRAIHGGLEQKKRSKVIEQFHKNEANILICTDVAARGLDIKDVSHVYNYDAPKTSEEYIHRIGRTARAGKEGMAISIVSNRDYDNFRKVMEDDSLNIERMEVPSMEKLNPDFGDRSYGRHRDSSGGDRRGSYRRGPGDGGGRGGGSRGGSSGGRGGYKGGGSGKGYGKRTDRRGGGHGSKRGGSSGGGPRGGGGGSRRSGSGGFHKRPHGGKRVSHRGPKKHGRGR